MASVSSRTSGQAGSRSRSPADRRRPCRRWLDRRVVTRRSLRGEAVGRAVRPGRPDWTAPAWPTGWPTAGRPAGRRYDASMPRRASLIVAAILAAGGFALPSPIVPSAAAIPPPTGSSARRRRAAGPPGVAAADIVPGSVGRSSIALEATYDAYLKIYWGSGLLWVDSTATIRNTSGGAIDRVELNTIADPPRQHAISSRSRSTARRCRPRSATRRSSCRSAASCRSVASTQVRVRYAARAADEPDRLELAVHQGQRHPRPVPLAALGQPPDRRSTGRTTATRSRRRPARSVKVRIVTSQRLVLATTGDRTGVSADGLVQTFRRQRRARLHGHRGHRLPDPVARSSGRRPSGSGTGRAPPARPCSMPRRTPSSALRSKLGPYPHPYFKVVQSAGGYGMESPGLIWIPTGSRSANLRYLVAHETAHQWFYGIVGNDQALEPFTDEAAADFVARYVLGLKRGEPLLDRPARPVDLPVLRDVLLRDGSTSRAATCSTRPAGGWARPPSGRRCVATSRHIGMRSRRRRRCSTRSTRRRRSTSAHTLFEPRFPRLY